MFEERIPVTDSWGRTIGDFVPRGSGGKALVFLLLLLLCGAVYGAFAVLAILPILSPFLAMYSQNKGRYGRAAFWWLATVVSDVGFIYLVPGPTSALAVALIIVSSALPALGLYFHKREASTAPLCCWLLTPVVYSWALTLVEFEF
jgi:hypothetical protein